MLHAKDVNAGRLNSEARKPRTCITPSMLAVLQSAFDMHCGHPSNEVRQRLALQLHMSPKSVQVWFQNRRQKLRGQQQQQQLNGGHPAMTLKPSQRAGVAPLSVGPSPTSSQDSMDWSPTQQMVADAERREAMQPFPPQAACVTPLSPQHNAPVYDLAAAAATPMHPSHAYALPRPEAFQTSLPAHILNELASVSSAEQDLANFARQLMQRKVDLLDNIRRIEQQAAAARQAHMVGVPSYPPAAQAPPQVYYKKEMPEPYRVREVERAPPQAEAITVMPRCDSPPRESPPSSTPEASPKASPPRASAPGRDDALAGLLGLSNAAASAPLAA